MNKNIEKMKSIRVNNNDLWMEILNIAFESNPKETKKIIKNIAKNDNKVKNIFNSMMR